MSKKKLKNNVFRRNGINAFSIAFYALFWVRKIVEISLTKIDPYKCIQSELETDF